MNLSHEVKELLRKIVLLLCRKYGFDDLTIDFNENHGKNGWFASSNSSGTSSPKQNEKKKSAKPSAKEGNKPSAAEKPKAPQLSAKAEAPAGTVTQEGNRMRRKILKEPKKVNLAAQSQHINKENAEQATQRERKANPGAKVIPKSYFTKDFDAVRDEVINKIRNNQFREIIGRGNQKRLQVDLDRDIGVVYNKDGTKSSKTNVVELVHAHDKGYHMWPARKKEGKK